MFPKMPFSTFIFQTPIHTTTHSLKQPSHPFPVPAFIFLTTFHLCSRVFAFLTCVSSAFPILFCTILLYWLWLSTVIQLSLFPFVRLILSPTLLPNQTDPCNCTGSSAPSFNHFLLNSSLTDSILPALARNTPGLEYACQLKHMTFNTEWWALDYLHSAEIAFFQQVEAKWRLVRTPNYRFF